MAAPAATVDFDPSGVGQGNWRLGAGRWPAEADVASAVAEASFARFSPEASAAPVGKTKVCVPISKAAGEREPGVADLAFPVLRVLLGALCLGPTFAPL